VAEPPHGALPEPNLGAVAKHAPAIDQTRIGLAGALTNVAGHAAGCQVRLGGDERVDGLGEGLLVVQVGGVEGQVAGVCQPAGGGGDGWRYRETPGPQRTRIFSRKVDAQRWLDETRPRRTGSRRQRSKLVFARTCSALLSGHSLTMR
jgi:hypothetical protein